MSEFKLTRPLAVYLVRCFLKDFPKLNALLRKEESSDKEIELAMNMAISNWNTTPPFLTPVDVEDFPVFDWLIIATAMYLLQMNGVLHFRNDLSYSDNGVAVNPWNKGPQYTGVASNWMNMLEAQKREFKVCMNYQQTFGFQRSPEFRLWDFRNYYTDYLGNALASGTGNVQTKPSDPKPPIQMPTRTDPMIFELSDWVAHPVTNGYVINFMHKLNADVDVRILNNENEDFKPKCKVKFVDPNLLTVWVPLDGRFEGQMVAYKM